LSGKSPVRSLFCLLFATLLLLSSGLGSRVVRAEETLAYPNIQVNRFVQIENGGVLVVNDTVTLSANASQIVQSLDSFQIGFPIEYKKNLAYFFAYDTSGKLLTTMDTSLNRAEFCLINVSFLQPINVSNDGSYNFTVVYVFSGLVKAEGTRSYRADFPLYPSLLKKTGFCNVTVMLPLGAINVAASPVFSNKIVNARQALYNETGFLEAFAYASSWARFTIDGFLLLEVDELRREMKIEGWGGLTATDYYQITNKEKRTIYEITLVLPPNSTDISVQDVYGAYEQRKVSVKEEKYYTEVKISLREALKTDAKVKLLIAYKIPFWRYVTQSGWQDFALNISLARPNNWIIKRLEVTVSLPEGAEFQSSTIPSSREKEVFLETVKFIRDNVTRFHESNFELKYRYSILWASFRPTLWVGTVVAIVGVMFFLRKAPKREVIVTAPLLLKVLKKFVDIYEERRKIMSEIGSLEQRVGKGKISRRQYKLRKSSLEGHLSRLQKDLAELKREIELAGGHYAERMKRLEIAETEIETLDRDIQRVEFRYRHRELSAEARRRLLEEYNRRKENAENTMAEVLLRIREEIR